MSSVTHELRTPLTSIRALSELMVDDPQMDSAQRQHFLGIVVAETERLSRLVNQVLDMAKIESGHAEWHTADVDLRALVVKAIETTHEVFRERGAEVTLDAPPAVPTLRADPDRLTQVLLNLLSMPPSSCRAAAVASTCACAATTAASRSRCATTAPVCRRPSTRWCSRNSARAATV